MDRSISITVRIIANHFLCLSVSIKWVVEITFTPSPL